MVSADPIDALIEPSDVKCRPTEGKLRSSPANFDSGADPSRRLTKPLSFVLQSTCRMEPEVLRNAFRKNDRRRVDRDLWLPAELAFGIA
jgi:hypothetical protein